jgi:hypothetical protein
MFDFLDKLFGGKEDNFPTPAQKVVIRQALRQVARIPMEGNPPLDAQQEDAMIKRLYDKIMPTVMNIRRKENLNDLQTMQMVQTQIEDARDEILKYNKKLREDEVIHPRADYIEARLRSFLDHKVDNPHVVEQMLEHITPKLCILIDGMERHKGMSTDEALEEVLAHMEIHKEEYKQVPKGKKLTDETLLEIPKEQLN